MSLQNKIIGKIIKFFLLFIIVFFSSCVSISEKKEFNQLKVYNSGIDNFISHKWNKAVIDFKKAEKLSLDKEDLNRLYFYRGKSYYFLHKYPNAVSDFINYYNNAPTGEFIHETRCLMAAIYPLKYVKELNNVKFNLVPVNIKKKCMLLYSSFLIKQSDYINSLINLNEIREITDNDNLKNAINLLIKETYFSLPDTVEVQLENLNNYFYDLSILKEIKNGNWDNLNNFVVDKSIPDEILYDYKYYNSYYKKLTVSASPKFYIFLPLSGPYSTIGVRIFQDFIYGLSVSAPITLGDTWGDMVLSSLYWDEIEKQTNPFVFGPVLRWEVNEVVPQNFIYRIPSITINSSSKLVQNDKFMIRDNLTPDVLIKELVKFSMDNGKKTFAIFQPDNDYGDTYATLFSQEVESRGGKIKWQVKYKENEKNFRFYFWKILGIKDRDEEREFFNSLKSKELDLDVDAVFIPELPNETGFLIPQFAYFGMKKMIFLGTRDWLKSEQLAESLGKYEVYIPGVFNPFSDEPKIEDFVDQYEFNLGKTPTSVDFFTYEVSKIFNVCYNLSRSRKDTINCLKRKKGFDVPEGIIRFDQFGEVIRPINIYTVKKWQWKAIKKN